MRKISGFNAVPAIIGSCLICISCGEKPVTPTLTTVNVDFVTSTTAVSGGNVTSDGGAPIVARGVCWSTASNPVIADDTTMVAGELGQFESFITGLTPSTKYFLRAYATNEAGTGYGYQMAFTTEPPVRIPLVTTGEITSTGSIYVISGGTMTDNGGEPCTVGICWGTSHNPAVTGSKDIKYLAEAGTFTCE